MSKESTEQDTAWNKAFEESGVQKAYEDLQSTMVERAKNWKADHYLFPLEEYELLVDVSKAESKLYSAYLDGDINDYTTDERTDIEQRLKDSISAKNQLAYKTVKLTKNALDNSPAAADELFDLYKEYAPKKELKAQKELDRKRNHYPSSPEDEINGRVEDIKEKLGNIGNNIGISPEVAFAGLAISAVAKYASKSAQADTIEGKNSHASKEETRRARRDRNKKIAFSVITGIVATFVITDGLLLNGKHTKRLLGSTKSNEPSNHR